MEPSRAKKDRRGRSRRRGFLWVAACIAFCTAAPGYASATSAAASTWVDEADLSPEALEHLRRGAEYYARGQYAQAEVEFTRVVHFAPDWKPIHFNIGAAAEAQGKLVTAIESYGSYMQHADDRRRVALALRLAELERRRDATVKAHRRQVALGWSLIAGGLAASTGGWVLLAYGARRDHGYMIAGGWVVGLVTLALPIAGIERLVQARKTKRRIQGLAISPVGSPDRFGGQLAFHF